MLVINGERDPFGVPEPDETTEVVVIPGETHALSKRPAVIGDAVTAWLGCADDGADTPCCPRAGSGMK